VPKAVVGRRTIPLVAATTVLVCGSGLFWLALPARGQVAVQNQGFVPFSDPPINYRSGRLTDPVAKLRERVDRGEVKLEYSPRHGYLESVLNNLGISPSSQTLVFSKTSFEYRKISPKTPRALYFNDDVYVGWVQSGKAVEIVSFDAMQGAIFYLLDQHSVEQPKIERAELDCTQCHVSTQTRNVPGVMLRSIFTNPSGTQATEATAYVTGQESPIGERWGGWYVTGTHGRTLHMGNELVHDKEHPEELDRAAGANVTDLSERFDTTKYLRGDSDIVAHLILAHQTQMHNLITLTNYQTRLALYDERGRPDGALSTAARKKFEEPAEELVRYLLFANEVPLDGPVRGTSPFAQEFAARGPRDPRGRSLRDFDLQGRIFKYPCSYLIYSEAFDALPDPAREYVYHRLFEVLTGREQAPEFARLSAQDRRAILEILLATKPGLPEEWTKLSGQVSRRAKDPVRERPGSAGN